MSTDGRASERVVLGWREYVDLPEWDVPHLVAKVDTGARTSAIDVAEIEELPGDRVRFTVVFDRDDKTSRRTIEAPVVRRTHVKSSLGHKHERLFVRTLVRIGDLTVEAELGLVGRKRMNCRMLLGRRFLRQGRFLVNSGRSYTLGRMDSGGDKDGMESPGQGDEANKP